MFTKYILVQKLDYNTSLLKEFVAGEGNLFWTFEDRRTPNSSEKKEIFPLVIEEPFSLRETKPGAETKVSKFKNGDIKFKDDYSVPEGFVICIISPIGYLPSMIKFNEKYRIPLEAPYRNRATPGYVQLYCNRSTRQSAVILFTSENAFFSFAVTFSPFQGDYPYSLTSNFSDTFEASIGLQEGECTYITQKDIRNFCQDYENITDLDGLVSSINEFLELMQEEPEKRKEEEIQDIKSKIGSILNNSVSVGSGITTLVDSVSNNGFAYNVIKTIFDYFS